MTRRSTLSEWGERFDDYARSGLSVERWCASRGIPSHRFYYWRLKVSEAASARDHDGIDWLSLPVAQTASISTVLTVRIGSAIIDVAPGFDPALLRSVVAALEPDARC